MYEVVLWYHLTLLNFSTILPPFLFILLLLTLLFENYFSADVRVGEWLVVVKDILWYDL